MYADGTLLFVTELHRLKKLVGNSVLLSCKLSPKNKICQVLKQVGVLDSLNVTEHIETIDDDVVHWRYAHGDCVLGAKYEDILQKFDGEITPWMQDELFKGITEAMTNVVNHAYSLESRDSVGVRGGGWWMFSQEMNSRLTVVFCDLGAGIPRTLPVKRPALWKRILSYGRTSDASAIKYSVQDSISRTGKKYRGKGLGQIVRVIKNEPGAKIIIHSNRGAFESHGGKPILKDYSDSIIGTLIFWQIPLHREVTS